MNHTIDATPYEYAFRRAAAANQILEALIDQLGLDEVVQCLSEVCQDKSEHIRESYNDNESAHDWLKRANLLNELVSRVQ